MRAAIKVVCSFGLVVGVGGSLVHFESGARKDERVIVEREKVVEIEKIVIQHEQVVAEKDSTIEQKTKEVIYVAKQRDAALAEVERLRSESGDALARMRESMAAAQAAAQGDTERTQRLVAAQGRILAECGQTTRRMGEDLERLAEENRSLRSRFQQLTK